MKQIKAMFVQKYNGQPNVMTPTVLAYGEVEGTDFIYEVSVGKGMSGDDIFGVTVLQVVEGEPEGTSLSKLLYSREEVEEYIQELQENV